MANPRSAQLIDILARVTVDENGCWVYPPPKGNDRAILRYDKKLQKAHRVAWQMIRGPIPEGINVLHKCDVGKCVNPEHLYLGTQLANMKDRVHTRQGGRVALRTSQRSEQNRLDRLKIKAEKQLKIRSKQTRSECSNRSAVLSTMLASVQVTASGCWLYNENASASRCYPRCELDGKVQLAHRVMWIIVHGELAPRTRVQHICRGERRCINPAHLTTRQGSHRNEPQP